MMKMTPKDKNIHLIDSRTTPSVAGSWVQGSLPEGCRLCIHGMKMVYFMGGDCSLPSRCKWYCPLSDERKSSSAHFINELPIKNPTNLNAVVKQLVLEAKAMDAAGMSITGGDPLSTSAKVDWVCAIIKAIKIELTDEFHVHLYTSGTAFDNLTADKLEQAGLDDLRFHPAEKDFHRLEFATGRHYTVAAEVPVIPTLENHAYLLHLADHLDMIGADFLNLNEFEMCATNRDALIARGFTLKENSLATVAHSHEYANKFLSEFSPRGGLSIHFCSVLSKDSVQIRQRYLRRANKIRFPYEVVNEDGCLLFIRIEGAASELSQLNLALLESAGMPESMIGLNLARGVLDVPSFLAEDENFIDLLNEYKLKAGILEIIPFREPNLSQIREYTPLMNNIASRILRKEK
ncbi:hypothetical protein WKT22_02448 [Candidatus Lokiarchaeum ossiferum]